MAVAARGAAEAARIVGALGKIVEGSAATSCLVENGTGRPRAGSCATAPSIIFSDDFEALTRGARLAEEARHAVAEDVTAVLYPDAIARANGTDVKTALALVMAQIQAAQAQGGPAAGARSRPSTRCCR